MCLLHGKIPSPENVMRLITKAELTSRSIAVVCARTVRGPHAKIRPSHHARPDRGLHYHPDFLCDPRLVWGVPDPDRRRVQLAACGVLARHRDPEPCLGDRPADFRGPGRETRGPKGDRPRGADLCGGAGAVVLRGHARGASTL